MRPEASKYRLPAIALHWALAALIVGMIGLGWYMTGLPRNTPERSFFFNLHKSLGLTAAMLIAVRIVWRLRHPAPPLPSTLPAWEARAALVSHRLLYLCMVLMPVTGYVGSSFSKYGVKYFGLELPNWGWEDKALRELFISFHSAISWVFVALIALHVLAAIKHLVLDRDGVFQRMLP